MLKFITALILLCALGARAQTSQQEDPFPGWVDPPNPAEIRKAASEKLRQREELQLVYPGGALGVVVYPTKMKVVLYRANKECLNTEMPIYDVYVNPLGWLTILVEAKKIRGCPDLRININPIDGVVGVFDYHIDTKEQAQDSVRLFLKKD